MDMRNTLPTMAKAALAVLLAWGGAVQAEAQTTGTLKKRDLIALQTYNDATTSDWTYEAQNGNTLYSSLASEDAHGKYVQNSYSTSQSGTTGQTSYCKEKVAFPTDADKDPGNDGYKGYIDEKGTEKGYIIEFDFRWKGAYGNVNMYYQFIVATGDEPKPLYNQVYNGNDYLFSLSLKKAKSSIGSGNSWHINDLTNANTATTLKTGSSPSWYHLKLVVTATSSAYTLTDASGESLTGSKSLTSLPKVTYIWALLANGTRLDFDNFEVYDYAESSGDDSGETVDPNHTLTAPTITWKETSGTNADAKMVYTITFGKGDVLHYQTESSGGFIQVKGGDTGVEETDDGKLSYDVAVTKSCTISAYTTYGSETTETSLVSVSPKFYSPVISSVSGLCSFSSANNVLVPDDVDVYTIIDSDNPNVGTSTKEVKLHKIDFGTNRHIVPALTGVFLYKDGGQTLTLPSVPGKGENDDPADAVSGLFEVASTHFQGTGDTQKIWGEGWLKDGKAQVAVFCLVKDATELAYVKPYVAIPANKAYLSYSASTLTSGSKLSLVFDDDATGIDGVKAFGDGQNAEEGSERTQGALYNLAGQRVDDAYKGIVVRNGRKYMKK